MYTYTIKTDALAVEVEASTIDAAAVTFGRSAGLSGDNCQEILESVSGVVGAWMWIESDDAPDGDRRGGSSPEVLQEYLAEVAAREAAEIPPRLEILVCLFSMIFIYCCLDVVGRQIPGTTSPWVSVGRHVLL
jgi:hypothetical protein